MTILEKVKETIKKGKFDENGNNGINELITYAYYLGRHDAAVECCDQAREIFRQQLERVKNSRFKNMAKEIQGNVKIIYHEDYSGDFIDMFKDDEVKGELV